jgi:hypothetical protein
MVGRLVCHFSQSVIKYAQTSTGTPPQILTHNLLKTGNREALRFNIGILPYAEEKSALQKHSVSAGHLRLCNVSKTSTGVDSFTSTS